ncbi:hypothetical protein M8G38_12805 [Providencia stuartii]|uniref:hypothetical protein n=1 Tax=Providencia stuartii TaxID=588 RepID=UPI00201DB741|nr:hypothetical protein [Providencia stuartii]UQZ10678.1 hypothetical protein M8G38_12805 [Providencia stuartii]
MAITYQDILSFAKDSMNREDEVGYRNAISRAYYAVYHRAYPSMKYGPNNSHQGLIDYLVQADTSEREAYDRKDLLALSYALQSMKGMRVIADYNLDHGNMTMINAQISIATGEKTIKRLLGMEATRKICS